MGFGWTLHMSTISLRYVGTGTRQQCIDYFPAKTCLCALRQHWTSIFSLILSQTNLDNIGWTIFLSIGFPEWSIKNCLGCFFIKVALLAMDQHYTGKTWCNVVKEAPDNVVLILSRQHCTGQIPMKRGPWGSSQQCTGKSCSMMCQYSWDNIAQVNTLGNEDPDNIAQKRILFNNVLILLGQHCTGKSFVLSCPRASRQHWAG